MPQVSYAGSSLKGFFNNVFTSHYFHVALYPSLSYGCGLKAFHYQACKLIVKTAFGAPEPFTVFVRE